MSGLAFVAQGQAPVSGQPGYRAFGDPAVFAEFVAGVDAFVGDKDLDALVAGLASEFGVVVGFVGVQLAGLAPVGSASGLDRGDGHHQGLECEGDVGVRRGDHD